MTELLDRHGIGLLGDGERWGAIRRWLHDGERMLGRDDLAREHPAVLDQLDEFDRVLAGVAAGIVDPSRPAGHPDAAAVDGRSLADAAAQAGLGELATLLKRRDSQGEFAAEPAEVSLLFAAQQRAYQRDHERPGDASFRADGGFSRLAVAMSHGLGDRLRLSTAALGVRDDGHRLHVLTPEGERAADHVVWTTSLVALRGASVEVPMAPEARRAVDGLGYGTVTKTAVQWPRRTWPRGYATTAAAVQRVYEPTVDQPGREGILMSYCGGDGGYAWATGTEADRVARAAAGMAELHGLADESLGGFSRAWSAQARYGGSYAVYRPGEVTAYWDVLRQPIGRLHLAGEHVATCTGYMEGALESAETVAARLLASR